MTLDEHIKKAEEDAELAEFDTEWGIGNYFINRSEALEYAKECRQIAEWLKDYKRLLGAIEDIKTEIDEHYYIVKRDNIYCAKRQEMALDIIDRHIRGKEN